MKNIYLFALLFMSTQLTAQTYMPKANMNTKRSAMSIVEAMGKLYVFGGTDGSGVLSSVEEYNPLTNVWTTKAPMIKAVTEAFAGTVNGKVYLIGGYSTNAVNNVQEYDPATNTWAAKQTMPTTRSVISGAVVNNKIYITCGWLGAYKTLEIYDPIANTWTTGLDMPSGFLQTNGGAAIGSDMYIMGGRSYGGGAYNYHYKYSTTGNSWASMSALPDSLFAGCVTVLNNKIHHFGGSDASSGNYYLTNTNSHYVYDVGNNLWNNGINLPKKRSGMSAVSYNNKIYLVGGTDSAGKTTSELWEYAETPVCLQPLSITITNVTTTSASLSWSPSALAVGYQYSFSINSSSPAQGIYTATTSAIDSTLNPVTKYYVHVRSICGPSDTSAWARDSFRTTMSVKNVDANDNHIKLYPNPVTDIVTVELASLNTAKTKLVICDMRGIVLKNIEISTAKTVIDLSALPKGLYLLKYTDDERQHSLKLLKL